MANPSPKPRAAKHDYSPKVRRAFWDALQIGAEENNCTLQELLWRWIDNTPDPQKHKWLDTLSRYEVRHKVTKGEISVEHRHTFPQLQADLKQLVAETSGRPIDAEFERVEDAGENRFVVSPSSRSEES